MLLIVHICLGTCRTPVATEDTVRVFIPDRYQQNAQWVL
jgi:hypothetical protein